jgi:hypothetical protein
MNLKLMLAPLALAPMIAMATPAAAQPVKATIVSGNKTVVVDTDTSYPVKAVWEQIAQATGLDARYIYVQVIAPKPAVLKEQTQTLESYGILTDFRAVARVQATPNY